MKSTTSMQLVFINRFYYPDHSATAQLLRDLAVHLTQSGHKVTVIASRHTYTQKGDLKRTETLEGVKVLRIPTTCLGAKSNLLRALDTLSFYFMLIPCLLRLNTSNAILVSKTDPPMMHVIVQCLAVLKGVPCVVWLQDMYPEMFKCLSLKVPTWLYKTLLFVRNKAFKRSAAIVVIGDQMRQHLIKQNLPISRLHSVPNWAPGNSVKYIGQAANPLRAIYNPDNKFVIMYSGNLGQVHDYQTLLNAAIKLEKDDSISMVFVGSGSNMAHFKNECIRLQLTNVHFHSYQPLSMLSASLSCADVSLVSVIPGMNACVYPSKLYGILAIGKPVLLVGDKESDIAQELLTHNAGLQVDCGDSAGLVSAILELKHNTKAHSTIGQNAVKLYNSEYTFGKSLLAWEKLLLTVHHNPKNQFVHKHSVNDA